MQALRWLMPRTGSAPVLRAAAPLSAVTVALVGWAATYGVLLAVVTVFGMAFGALEVAAKAQGSAVENGYGRPLMGLMHAGWPVGAGLGAWPRRRAPVQTSRMSRPWSARRPSRRRSRWRWVPPCFTAPGPRCLPHDWAACTGIGGYSPSSTCSVSSRSAAWFWKAR
jgi:hypothetical protein